MFNNFYDLMKKQIKNNQLFFINIYNFNNLNTFKFQTSSFLSHYYNIGNKFKINSVNTIVNYGWFFFKNIILLLFIIVLILG